MNLCLGCIQQHIKQTHEFRQTSISQYYMKDWLPTAQDIQVWESRILYIFYLNKELLKICENAVVKHARITREFEYLSLSITVE